MTSFRLVAPKNIFAGSGNPNGMRLRCARNAAVMQPERTSAATSRENLMNTNHENQTGGELAAAPCSAGDAPEARQSKANRLLQTVLSGQKSNAGSEKRGLEILMRITASLSDSESKDVLRAIRK